MKNHGTQFTKMGSTVFTTTTTPFLFSILLIISIILPGCDFKIGGKKKDDKKDLAAPVLLSRAEVGSISSFLLLNATVEPAREVELFSRSVGQLVELNVEEGDKVTAGELLVKLDDSEQVLARNRAQAVFEKETARLKRAEELYQKQMLAEDDYQQIQLALNDARIALEQTELALEYTRITAPFDGMIAMRYVDLGDRVDLARSLFRLVDQSYLLVNGWISETDQYLLYIGQKVSIAITGKEDYPGTASLIRISPIIDPVYGKVKATFKITDPGIDLKPGQFVEIKLTLETHDNVLLLPKQALVYEAGNPIVFVYKDSLALRRPVAIGLQSGTKVELLKGIGLDDQVIIEGQATIRDSSRVKPVNPVHREA